MKANEKRLNTVLAPGSDVILKKRRPMAFRRSGTVIEVIAGNVWIAAGGIDTELAPGDRYRVQSARCGALAQNLGRHPATIRIWATDPKSAREVE